MTEADWTFTSPAACACNLPSGGPHMEKMPSDTSTYDASTIITTNANANPQPRAHQQGHKVKCIHLDFNQHFIKEEP